MYARVAAAVRSARKENGLSAQDVADATAELGYPISRSRIANLENGRKQSIDVAELAVLAAALGVPPVMLLYGGQPDRDIEMLPGRTEASVFAMGWFTGDTALADDAVAQPDSREATILGLTRERAVFQRNMASLRATASEYTKAGDTEEAGQAMLHADTLRKQIEQHNSEIAQLVFWADDRKEDEE